MGGRRQVKFNHYKRGGEKSFSYSEMGGGSTNSFEVVLMWDT